MSPHLERIETIQPSLYKEMFPTMTFSSFYTLFIIMVAFVILSVRRFTTFDRIEKLFFEEIQITLNDPSEKWGQKRGCFQASDDISTWDQALWNQCLYNCAHTGHFFAALGGLRCGCFLENSHTSLKQIDDDLCNKP